MILKHLTILNYKNIREADLTFSDKLNCFVGMNGQGKTNLLDAIYLLSFTKSAFTSIDSQLITHDSDMAMVQGEYLLQESDDNNSSEIISCGLKRGQKKQLRRGKKDYKRLIEHIGLLPLVMVSPEDQQLIADGSEERRKFMDVVISQQDKQYLVCLTQYTHLLRQRNALLKRLADSVISPDASLVSVFDEQMIPLAEYIHTARRKFIEAFIPVFQEMYSYISDGQEQVSLRYISQLSERDLREWYPRTLQRDLILGWTSQGIHKDDIEMTLGNFPLKQVGSQGQQKTYLLSMKLAQALYLGKPILLLDDIFDKLDTTRVERIINLVQSDRFGQVFITDTDRQHLSVLIQNSKENAHLFHVNDGAIDIKGTSINSL